jgi:hypothetical protein
VVLHSHLVPQWVGLSHHAQVGGALGELAQYRVAIHEGVAAVRSQLAGQHRQSGSLTGSVGAQQTQHLSTLHHETHVLTGDDVLALAPAGRFVDASWVSRCASHLSNVMKLWMTHACDMSIIATVSQIMDAMVAPMGGMLVMLVNNYRTDSKRWQWAHSNCETYENYQLWGETHEQEGAKPVWYLLSTENNMSMQSAEQIQIQNARRSHRVAISPLCSLRNSVIGLSALRYYIK